jgi:hypothetical protein
MLSTVELLELTSLDEALLINITYSLFRITGYLNEEVNCTEPLSLQLGFPGNDLLISMPQVQGRFV